MTPPVSKCPRCGAAVKWDDTFPERPFCSERCKLLDLGAWLSESHRIPGDTTGEPPSGRDPESSAQDS